MRIILARLCRFYKGDRRLKEFLSSNNGLIRIALISSSPYWGDLRGALSNFPPRGIEEGFLTGGLSRGFLRGDWGGISSLVRANTLRLFLMHRHFFKTLVCFHKTFYLCKCTAECWKPYGWQLRWDTYILEGVIWTLWFWRCKNLANSNWLSKTKQRERPLRGVIIRAFPCYIYNKVAFIYASAWGFQRCSVWQSGQCESLYIVDRAQNWLHVWAKIIFCCYWLSTCYRCAFDTLVP